MYKDAIDTCAESGDPEITEELLRFFVEKEDKASFSATLYTCYDLVSPDVAVELAWRNNLTDNVMPYVIQYMKHLHEKVATMEQRTAPPVEEKNPEEEANAAAAAGLIMGGLIMGNETMMIQNGGGQGYPQQQQQGQGGGIPDPYAQQQQYQQQPQGFPQQGYGGGF